MVIRTVRSSSDWSSWKSGLECQRWLLGGRVISYRMQILMSARQLPAMYAGYLANLCKLLSNRCKFLSNFQRCALGTGELC